MYQRAADEGTSVQPRRVGRAGYGALSIEPRRERREQCPVRCRQWADRSVLVCKAWADRVEKECREWGNATYRRRRKKRAEREAEARAAWEEAVAARSATIEPGVRAVEILALLREMSLLRRWDAKGRLRAIERFRRRVTDSDVRRYIADVRGMVRVAKGRSTAVTSALVAESPGDSGEENP